MSRVLEHEALAKMLVRRYGIERGYARSLALTASSSPLSPEGSRKGGRPPANYELFDMIDVLQHAHDGKLPVGQGFGFWKAVTLHWNAKMLGTERPERQFLTPQGQPDWRRLQAAYRIAARGMEAKLGAILAARE